MCCTAPGTLCPKAILWLMIFEPLFEIERQVCKFLENNLLVYITKYISTTAQQQVNYALYFKRWPHCGGIQARLHKLMGYCSDVYISETLRLWSFKWVFFLATSDSLFIGKTKVINILAIELWLLGHPNQNLIIFGILR